MRSTHLLVAVASLFSMSACSAAPEEPGAGSGMETWSGTRTIDAPLTIAEGKIVSIASGAQIRVATGASITVKGTLRASTGAQAKLMGTDWGGIVVARGGRLELTGVDLEDATTALTVQAGAARARYERGAISYATPLVVEKGAALEMSNVKITETGGESQIAGSLVADHVSYDTKGFDGFVATEDGAELTLSDVKLWGDGLDTGDAFTSKVKSRWKVSHIDVTNIHCGFHFSAVSEFDVSSSNVHGCAVGFMLYGSDSAGTRVVEATNIHENKDWGAEEGGTNGVITFKNGYWAKNGEGGSPAHDVRKTSSAIVVENMSSTTPVEGVGARL